MRHQIFSARDARTQARSTRHHGQVYIAYHALLTSFAFRASFLMPAASQQRRASDDDGATVSLPDKRTALMTMLFLLSRSLDYTTRRPPHGRVDDDDARCISTMIR